MKPKLILCTNCQKILFVDMEEEIKKPINNNREGELLREINRLEAEVDRLLTEKEKND